MKMRTIRTAHGVEIALHGADYSLSIYTENGTPAELRAFAAVNREQAARYLKDAERAEAAAAQIEGGPS